jgi:hypothetical protein
MCHVSCLSRSYVVVVIASSSTNVDHSSLLLRICFSDGLSPLSLSIFVVSVSSSDVLSPLDFALCESCGGNGAPFLSSGLVFLPLYSCIVLMQLFARDDVYDTHNGV